MLILEEQGKKDEARKLIAEARTKFPKSVEIVGLDAALKVKDLKPEEAEKSLADYLAGDPDNITIAMRGADPGR